MSTYTARDPHFGTDLKFGHQGEAVAYAAAYTPNLVSFQVAHATLTLIGDDTTMWADRIQATGWRGIQEYLSDATGNALQTVDEAAFLSHTPKYGGSDLYFLDTPYGHQMGLVGEVEAKTEPASTKTGNMFTEFRQWPQYPLHERANNPRNEPDLNREPCKMSGIASTTAPTWCEVFTPGYSLAAPCIIATMDTEWLKARAREAFNPNRRKFGGLKDKNPAEGCLVPISVLFS